MSNEIFCRYCGCYFDTIADAWDCHCGREAMFLEPLAMLAMRRDWVGTDKGPVHPAPTNEMYLRA